MHSPWRFWGLPVVGAAVVIVLSWLGWRRSQSRAWAISALCGALSAGPAWLAGLVPGFFAEILIEAVWRLKQYNGHDQPEWFAAHDNYGIGPFVAMTCVLAGPFAFLIVTALRAMFWRRTAFSGIVFGFTTGATVLVVAAFAAFVVPARSAVERARTTDFTEARRIALSEQTSANESLWLAIRMRDDGAVERMLYHGQSPDVVNSRGETALIMAADLCDDFVVETLLRHGASVAHKDPSGRDALAHAIGSHEFGPCPQTIVALSRAGALPQRDALCVRLVEAAATGDKRIVASLAQLADRNGMKDVVAIGYDSAVRSGQEACAKTLAAYGPLPPATSCGATDPATTGAH
jgi:hypothetical protein